MVDTPHGQISVPVVEPVVQVFKCDNETVQTLLQNMKEEIASEIPQKQRLVMIYIVQVTYLIITHK